MSGMRPEFFDLTSLDKFIENYEKKNSVHLWKRDSRTIEKTKSICPLKLIGCNEQLKYYSITYACGKGGKQFKSRSKGLRKKTTRKENCPFKLRVQMSQNGQTLQVVHILEEHNHVCSKDVYKRKRLRKDEKVEITRHKTEETFEDESSSAIWLDLDQFNEDYPDPLTHEEEENYSSAEESNIKQESFESSSPPPFKKSKRNHFRNDSVEQSSDTSNSEFTEDAFDIYGKYIASQLRNMDMKNALEAQIEIQTVISRARIASIDKKIKLNNYESENNVQVPTNF